MSAVNAVLQSSEDMKVNAQKIIDELRVNLIKLKKTNRQVSAAAGKSSDEPPEKKSKE